MYETHQHTKHRDTTRMATAPNSQPRLQQANENLHQPVEQLGGVDKEAGEVKATEFKTTDGQIICVGHELDIIATNQYNGSVNEVDGEICLETAFFNKPLSEHLTAVDLQSVYITSQPDASYCLFCGEYSCDC